MPRTIVHSRLLLARLLLAAAVLSAMCGSDAARAGQTERRRPTAEDLTANVVRIETREAPAIDGDLSDPVWAKATIIENLRQRQPDYLGEPTERTVVRVMYDENNLYFGVYAYDSEPGEIIVRAMARDGEIGAGDNFNLIIDPSLSRKNAYSFQVGPSGGRSDALRLNNIYELGQWNAIWEARTKLMPDGWVGEVAIPFRSLSYNEGQTDWGFVFARTIRRKNENDRWGSTNPALAVVDVSEGGTLTGFHDINAGIGLDVQPYVAVRAKHDWSTHGDGAGLSATAGGNAFYKITPALTGTLTLNPDFSDAPLDIRQVNTTRFSLFLPETRSFFLQDAASFEYGGRTFRRDSEDSQSNNGRPFFSRNLGLVDGQPVSIIGGGKLSGEYGGFNIGALSVYTGDTPAGPGQSLSVLRVTKPVFSQSLLGIVVTDGDPTGLSRNSVLGGDFQYRDTTTIDGKTIQADAYFERSFSSVVGDDDSYGVALNFPNEPWYGDLTYKVVGTNFTPALGFVNRQGIRLYDVSGGRRLRYTGSALRTWDVGTRQQVFTDLNGRLQSRQHYFNTSVLTASDHNVYVAVYDQFERLNAPFDVVNNVTVPLGDYDWVNGLLSWQTPVANVLSLYTEISCCSYYGGRSYSGYFSLSYKPNQYYEANLVYAPNLIRLPGGDVDIHVASLNAVINFTPDMQVGIQAQYDNISESFGFLARYRWEFRPGSDILLAVGQSALVPAGLGIQPQATQASLRVTHTLRF